MIHDNKIESNIKPDHGENFVPGSETAPENRAPKPLDHFKRGYKERAELREREMSHLNMDFENYKTTYNHTTTNNINNNNNNNNNDSNDETNTSHETQNDSKQNQNNSENNTIRKMVNSNEENPHGKLGQQPSKKQKMNVPDVSTVSMKNQDINQTNDQPSSFSGPQTNSQTSPSSSSAQQTQLRQNSYKKPRLESSHHPNNGNQYRRGRGDHQEYNHKNHHFHNHDYRDDTHHFQSPHKKYNNKYKRDRSNYDRSNYDRSNYDRSNYDCSKNDHNYRQRRENDFCNNHRNHRFPPQSSSSSHYNYSDSSGEKNKFNSKRRTIPMGFEVKELVNRLAAPGCYLTEELDHARKVSPQSFESGKAITAILSLLARMKNIRVALSVWKWMEHSGIERNVFHFNSLISVCEKMRDWRRALNLLEQMEREGISKNEVTFSSAISACEKSGNWQMAINLLERMHREGIPRTAIAYNAAISACEKGLNPSKALEIFERMKKECVRPTVITYSALISACEKGQQWKLALEVLDEMKEAGFGANVIAYSAAISALSKGQQWEMALELFREIEQSGGNPSVVTYNATMTALEKGLQWERALDLFDEMKFKNLPITVVSYGSAISACEKGYQWRQCLEFLDEMTERGIKKNVIIFGAAMSCMEKSCRADIAFQLMDRMKVEGVNPNVHIYNSAISACARCNMWEKGIQLFEEMDEVGVVRDVVTYNAVLDAVCCQVSLARKLFQDGVEKGFYARVSRLGTQWLELDLHFLSLGGGEIALGWWFEECLVPYLCNSSKLEEVKSIDIVTGYGKTRMRGARRGDDGMRKRVRTMLKFMNVKEINQPNRGRIHIDKGSLIAEVEKNGGRIIFDSEGYHKFKEEETIANAMPDVVQIKRNRYGAPRRQESFNVDNNNTPPHEYETIPFHKQGKEKASVEAPSASREYIKGDNGNVHRSSDKDSKSSHNPSLYPCVMKEEYDRKSPKDYQQNQLSSHEDEHQNRRDDRGHYKDNGINHFHERIKDDPRERMHPERSRHHHGDHSNARVQRDMAPKVRRDASGQRSPFKRQKFESRSSSERSSFSRSYNNQDHDSYSLRNQRSHPSRKNEPGALFHRFDQHEKFQRRTSSSEYSKNFYGGNCVENCNSKKLEYKTDSRGNHINKRFEAHQRRDGEFLKSGKSKYQYKNSNRHDRSNQDYSYKKSFRGSQFNREVGNRINHPLENERNHNESFQEQYHRKRPRDNDDNPDVCNSLAAFQSATKDIQRTHNNSNKTMEYINRGPDHNVEKKVDSQDKIEQEKQDNNIAITGRGHEMNTAKDNKKVEDKTIQSPPDQ